MVPGAVKKHMHPHPISEENRNRGQGCGHILGCKERRRSRVFRGGRNCIIGIFAIAMGAGILIAAIFPTGLLMFLVATLLTASGCACWKR